jgi:hypothetical protein
VRRLSKHRGPQGWRSIAAFAAASVAASAIVAAPPLASARQKTHASPPPAATVTTPPDSPLIVVVSIRKQRVRVFDANGQIATSRVSTGRPGFATPTGVFSILQKDVRHRSNIYSGAEMPYMQRITWSGIALHAGVVPGFRASHGCIRLPFSFSKTLFNITKVGNRVIVAGDDAEPVAFSSPKLFKPLPLDDATAMRSDAGKEQRLAINDQPDDDATSDALVELPRLIGVSPALARAVADMPRDPQRRASTRAEAEQMMREKLGRAQAALKAAEAAGVASADRAKETANDFDAANQRLQAAQQAIEPLKAAVTAAEKNQQDAIRVFETYMSAEGSNVAAEDSGRRESELETAVLALTQQADQAREAAAMNEMSFAEVQASFSAAKAARDGADEAVSQAKTDLISAQGALAEANRDARRHSKPISVLVSLRSQRIYVRQGVDPVLEAPITVTPLPGRVGTHVFTAMRYDSRNPNQFDWRLVSAQTPSPGEAFENRRNRSLQSPQSDALNVQMATAALDAFAIPDDILSTISELAKPGSSLIVSDRELPLNENGDGTEFVVLTK